MASASNVLENNILNYFFRNQAVTRPASLYLALYISDPTDSDTGTEVSGTGYARQQIAFTEPTQVSGKGTIYNSEAIQYGTAGATWGTVAFFGVRDAANGGNLLAYGPFSIAKSVASGDQIVLDSGSLSISLD